MPTRGIFLVALLVAGCNIISPYKIDIQQGNFVTQDMIAKLQLGMTRSQVRFALGTPLMVDPFHNDRWDYVYRYMKAGTLTEQRRLKVHFSKDTLARVEGDGVPAALNPAPTDKSSVPATPVDKAAVSTVPAEKPAVPAAPGEKPTVPAAPAQPDPPAAKPATGG
jgi:outer membrane protein assembly factor BamE